MKIYTRTGDKGMTGLFGGDRVSKSSVRLHAYGTIDELNACLGIVLSDKKLPEPLTQHLERIQHTLFVLGADLATPLASKAAVPRLQTESATELEGWIDQLESGLPPLQKFIHPGGVRAGAELHFARTVCRRAERWLVELAVKEKVNEAIIPYVNRLSDYLFVAARFVNKASKVPERMVKLRDN